MCIGYSTPIEQRRDVVALIDVPLVIEVVASIIAA
jgi:hypothetical protein